MLCHWQVRNGLVMVSDVFVSLKCAVEHAINSLSQRYESILNDKYENENKVLLLIIRQYGDP